MGITRHHTGAECRDRWWYSAGRSTVGLCWILYYWTIELTKVTMMYLALALTLTMMYPSLTLDCVDTLISTGKANTLVQLVAKADLASALRVGSITIFAPTDDAFASLPCLLTSQT